MTTVRVILIPLSVSIQKKYADRNNVLYIWFVHDSSGSLFFDLAFGFLSMFEIHEGAYDRVFMLGMVVRTLMDRAKNIPSTEEEALRKTKRVV